METAKLEQTEVSKAIRDFVDYDLRWLANFLHKTYGLNYNQIRKLLHERIDESI